MTTPGRTPSRSFRNRPTRWADFAVHFLYTPTMLGRRSARARWHHRIHLIPQALMERVCDAHDEALLRDTRYLDSLPWEGTVGPFVPWHEAMSINGVPLAYDPNIQAFTATKGEPDA